MFPADVVVLDMQEDQEIPLILGRRFLATGRALIDVQRGELKLRVQGDEVTFNVLNAMKYPDEECDCFYVDNVTEAAHGFSLCKREALIGVLSGEENEDNDKEEKELVSWLNSFGPNKRAYFEDLGAGTSKIPPSIVQAPNLEMKPLPSHLKYAYLGEGETLPIIISADLSIEEEEQLLEVVNEHKSAIAWTLADIQGINPSYCMHRILMEDDCKPSVEHQRRLNPTMKEVVRKEILKWLDAGIIYPISDSQWVSPVQVVPKKGGITVVRNEKDELIPMRAQTGWRICIDYRKLNKATRKDHFPLPFLDQMLDRLAGQEYFCFLDGYSGYNQIAIAPEDQEKTTFTCPYGTFAFRRMPFSLCNAPTTFQRCMMAVFSDMVEQIIEVFMDGFSVYGSTFDDCLINLRAVLQRCAKTSLVLNWEKCHFMVKEGIVLGLKISKRGLEDDSRR